MARTTVYYFNKWSGENNVRSNRPATREAIIQCRGVLLEDTAQEVEMSQLDGNGFLESAAVSIWQAE